MSHHIDPGLVTAGVDASTPLLPFIAGTVPSAHVLSARNSSLRSSQRAPHMSSYRVPSFGGVSEAQADGEAQQPAENAAIAAHNAQQARRSQHAAWHPVTASKAREEGIIRPRSAIRPSTVPRKPRAKPAPQSVAEIAGRSHIRKLDMTTARDLGSNQGTEKKLSRPSTAGPLSNSGSRPWGAAKPSPRRPYTAQPVLLRNRDNGARAGPSMAAGSSSGVMPNGKAPRSPGRQSQQPMRQSLGHSPLRVPGHMPTVVPEGVLAAAYSLVAFPDSRRATARTLEVDEASSRVPIRASGNAGKLAEGRQPARQEAAWVQAAVGIQGRSFAAADNITAAAAKRTPAETHGIYRNGIAVSSTQVSLQNSGGRSPTMRSRGTYSEGAEEPMPRGETRTAQVTAFNDANIAEEHNTYRSAEPSEAIDDVAARPLPVAMTQQVLGSKALPSTSKNSPRRVKVTNSASASHLAAAAGKQIAEMTGEDQVQDVDTASDAASDLDGEPSTPSTPASRPPTGGGGIGRFRSNATVFQPMQHTLDQSLGSAAEGSAGPALARKTASNAPGSNSAVSPLSVSGMPSGAIGHVANRAGSNTGADTSSSAVGGAKGSGPIQAKPYTKTAPSGIGHRLPLGGAKLTAPNSYARVTAISDETDTALAILHQPHKAPTPASRGTMDVLQRPQEQVRVKVVCKP